LATKWKDERKGRGRGGGRVMFIWEGKSLVIPRLTLPETMTAEKGPETYLTWAWGGPARHIFGPETKKRAERKRGIFVRNS